MELIIKGKLENVFKAKDFLNRETGEIESKGKWTAQMFEQIDGEEGAQLVVHKISIPDEKIVGYREKVGDIVQIPVKTYVSKGKVGYYGI